VEVTNQTLSESTAQVLLQAVAPGHDIDAIRPVGGDFANREFYLDAHGGDGETLHLVVKLYQGEYQYCVRRARVEYKALEWLYLYQKPAPVPVFIDGDGSLLGGPAIVTRFLPGKPVICAPYPEDWGRQMALTLASIHAYPVDEAAKEFLLDANHEALWFHRSGKIPAWLADDPHGELIWRGINDLQAKAEVTEPKLVHLDYWGGNILCEQGKITGVVDWEEASYGDPGVDVAYCLMDLALCGLDHEAEAFLATYTAQTGAPVANLNLWKLAAAARPIYIPKGYIDYSPARERFRQFVRAAVSNGAG
jgi:aminoglycoside phosphotransferase (APT) family kinase protein